MDVSEEAQNTEIFYGHFLRALKFNLCGSVTVFEVKNLIFLDNFYWNALAFELKLAVTI